MRTTSQPVKKAWLPVIFSVMVQIPGLFKTSLSRLISHSTWQVADRRITPHLVRSHLCVLSYTTLLSGDGCWRGLLENDIVSLHIILPKALGQGRKCLS